MGYSDPEKQREYQQNWYQKNSKSSVAERSRMFRERRREWFDLLKKDKPCSDCGGLFPPCCLDYHHLDGAIKEDAVTNLLSKASKKRIFEEIAKCVLVCANCHRIRHHGV